MSAIQFIYLFIYNAYFSFFLMELVYNNDPAALRNHWAKYWIRNRDPLYSHNKQCFFNYFFEGGAGGGKGLCSTLKV